jgi:hypothetical protein
MAAETATPPGVETTSVNKLDESPYEGFEFEYMLTLDDAVGVLKAVAPSLSPAERAVLKTVASSHPVLRKAYAELAAGGELGEVAVIESAPEELVKAVESRLAEALRPFRIYKVPADRLHELLRNVECADDGGRIVLTLEFNTARGLASITLKYDEFFDKNNNTRVPPRLIRWLRKYGVQVTPGKAVELVARIDRVPCTRLASATTSKIRQALLTLIKEGACSEESSQCADIILSTEEVHVSKPFAVKIFVEADLKIRGKGAVASYLEKLGVLKGSATHRCSGELANYYIFAREALEEFIGAKIEDLCRPFRNWIFDLLEGGGNATADS